MDPVSILKSEHDLILRMHAIMDSELDRLKERSTANLFLIDNIVDFIEAYVRGCHQGKEELLFDCLSSKDINTEDSVSISHLREEHGHERKMVAALSHAREEYSRGFTDEIDDIYQGLRKLAGFLPRHARHEEQGLFRRCLGYFSKDQTKEMVKDFWEFDRKLIHKKYRYMVERFE
ncbi:MAG: hemerythrin domain-containing protein [Actinomycetota bacterium]